MLLEHWEIMPNMGISDYQNMLLEHWDIIPNRWTSEYQNVLPGALEYHGQQGAI
jgi:hypothetical protein